MALPTNKHDRRAALATAWNAQQSPEWRQWRARKGGEARRAKYDGVSRRAICSIVDCQKYVHGNSLCSMHYWRVVLHGDAGYTRRERGRCVFTDCGKPLSAHGLCSGHRQQRLAGQPLAALRVVSRGTPAERFWAKVDKTDTCWLWTGTAGRYGWFGVASSPRVSVYAHRFAYEATVGPIPEGYEVDHLCRVTLCVNPAHLEPVTPQENKRRAREARKVAA